jgi:hypothetical protein
VACRSAAADQAISATACNRAEDTNGWVETNASSAAKTYFTTACAIGLSVAQSVRRQRSAFGLNSYSNVTELTVMVSPLTSPTTLIFRLSFLSEAFSAASIFSFPAASNLMNLSSEVITP